MHDAPKKKDLHMFMCRREQKYHFYYLSLILKEIEATKIKCTTNVTLHLIGSFLQRLRVVCY